MVTIKIGTTERNINEADPGWINQQIVRRRKDKQPVCVRVTIHEDSVNMVLTTPDCSAGGGRRPPNSKENNIIELWDKHRLNTNDFTGGNLVAFIKKLANVLS
ncbi:MAG: hypothetical protein ACYSYT_06630 [Planctomycetota bacterium]|jgi:hypothetical protein